MISGDITEYTADEQAAIDAHRLALAVCRECITRPSSQDMDVYARAVARLQRLGIDVRYYASGMCVYGRDLADELEDE